MVPRRLIVAVEIGGTVIRGDEEIQIAVAIEVAVGEAAPNFRLLEAATNIGGHVAKTLLARVKKKLWWLGIANIAANVANRFINVSVGHGEVEPAIQVDIKKCAAETQTIP